MKGGSIPLGTTLTVYGIKLKAKKTLGGLRRISSTQTLHQMYSIGEHK